MSDAIETFLRELPERGQVAWLRPVNGSIRVDLREGGDTDSWVLTFDAGRIEVAEVGGGADVTVAGERDVFNRLVAGQTNTVAAVLRGALHAQGRLELLYVFQRLMPPATARAERAS